MFSLDAVREGSIVSKMFNDLKDGKVKKFDAFRAKYIKLGIKRPRQMVFRLDRILRMHTNLQINNSKKTNSIQIVKRDNAVAARAAVAKLGWAPATWDAAKVSTKKAVKKHTTKVSKPVSKKATVKATNKKANVKKVAVPAGVEDDDEVLEA
jgi:hypothetical protein